MRTIRLYVDAPLADGHELALPEAAARHVLRVLRLTIGQPLVLFNGDGYDYDATLQNADACDAMTRVNGRRPVDNEPPWPLVLAQCLARGDKMDLVVQKATELGATRIVPLLGERSEVRLDAIRAGKRLRHWQAIAIAACEQCGRARVPEVDPPRTLPTWVAETRDEAMLRLALLPTAQRRIRDLQPSPAGVALVIGPEGGFGERDTAALTAAGFTGLSLGPRILRTETAGLAALAALLACHGDA